MGQSVLSRQAKTELTQGVRSATVFLGIFCAYFITAKIGLKIDAVSGFATLVWPPSGIALASLVLFGRRFWPAIFLAAFIVNLTSDAPLLSAMGIGMGNTLEAITATFVLGRYTGFRKNLDRLGDVVTLVIVAVFCCTLGATCGVFSLWLGNVNIEGIAVTWAAWWIGDALGILIMAPLILVCGTSVWPKLSLRRGTEVFFFSISLLKMNVILFSPFCVELGTRNATLAYLLFPFIIWAAIRFDRLGAVWTVFTISVAAVWGTQQGYGPFSHGELRENLFLLHSFISIVALTTMAMMASVCERKQALEDRTRLIENEQKARREAEVDRRRTEESIHARDNFLSIASHELRTPLTSLYLQLQMIERMLKSSLTGELNLQKLEDRVDSSQAQAKQLDNLIGILLDASKIGGGEFLVQKEEVNLNELIGQVIQEFPERNKDIQILACDTIIACVDRSRIARAIANLISNALKYGEGRRIDLAVVLGPSGKTAQVSVKDHGLGIEAKDQKRIFERFERTISHRNISGMGLGLYIVREIAQAHEGRVLVESELRRGSTFILEVPLGDVSRSIVQGEKSS